MNVSSLRQLLLSGLLRTKRRIPSLIYWWSIRLQNKAFGFWILAPLIICDDRFCRHKYVAALQHNQPYCLSVCQQKDDQAAHNSERRNDDSSPFPSESTHGESPKIHDALDGFSSLKISSRHSRLPFALQSKANRNPFLEHVSRIASLLLRFSFYILSVPVRTMALWANAGYDGLAWKPFMPTLFANTLAEIDRVHSRSISIIQLSSRLLWNRDQENQIPVSMGETNGMTFSQQCF